MKAKQFLVVGAGRFGAAVATTLYELKHEVVVIDEDEEAIENIMDKVTHALIADATDEATLRKIGCSNFDAIIIAIGENFEANILATVAAKSLGAQHVISKAKDLLSARVLERIGADMVIRPEHDMGVRLAGQLSSPTVIDALEMGDGHEVIEVEISAKLCGRLAELRLPNRFGVQVITVSRNGEITVSPHADFVLQDGDMVLLVGHSEAIDKLRTYLAD
ncbi:MAG: TrkA family potassium uptake protein [Caldilineaceae bacterium]|nr:TrkA family potassium uptake protein [Caldilineaceae bacterium]MCB9148917.1 TrkA family potassium uptake protein [Caldilineaceae bacterium]MCB9155631.1 TrkA family potassium uptake protein [Caldilineaceae bacterium]